MSGWGKKDSKTASGTVAITTGGAVTGTGTSFTTQAAVGDFMRVGAQEFVITAIASNTAATVVASTPGASITTVNAGASYALNEKPLFLRYGDATDITSQEVYGVDATEMGVTEGPAHAGWVHVRTVKTGAIAAVDTVAAADAARKSGIYLVAGTSSGSGTGQLFRITVSAAGAASIEIVQSGAGHADNDTITVTDSLLGNGGAANLTFLVNGVVSKKRYETLVALTDNTAAVMGDAEDTVFPDA
jgi:hypothetical protein